MGGEERCETAACSRVGLCVGPIWTSRTPPRLSCAGLGRHMVTWRSCPCACERLALRWHLRGSSLPRPRSEEMLYCLCTFCFATLGALCFATFFGHEGEPLFCFGDKKNEYNFSKEPVYKQFFFLQCRVLWT